jgi:predicted ATPase
LGVTHTLDVRSWEALSYQVLAGLGRGKDVTIADLGFGVSQLLPILVLCLQAEAGSLLIFEQPEIHLHPRIQANLADFFLGAAQLNRGCILIETHSDHFINRLRRRIAEDTTDTLRDLVGVHFVRGRAGGRGASIEQLQVDRYGAIENWPPDFLPEAADEAGAILRAAIGKRAKPQ